MISSIQFLRAFAALMVVWYHACVFADKFGGYQVPISNAGAAGVDIFFVISGFIITHVTRAGTTSQGDFIVRRLIRVVPLYWLYTFVTVAILFAIPSSFAHLKFDVGQLVLSCLLLLSANNAGVTGTVLGVGWTICYEFYFYLLFAGFMFVPKRFSLYGMGGVILLFAVLQIYIVPPPFASVALSALPLEFLAGCLLARFFERQIFLPKYAALLSITSALLYIYWIGSQNVIQISTDQWRVLYFGVPAVALTAGLLSLDGRQLIKIPQSFIAIGDASYSLYLSHQFVLLAIIKIWTILQLSHLPSFLLLLSGMVMSIVYAMMTFRWIEKPMTNQLNRYWKKMQLATA